MIMPKKLKKEWVKALRSGEYDQCSETLCDGEGGFCCLGVLQDVAMDGEIEVDAFFNEYRDIPTQEFWDYAGIEVKKSKYGPRMSDKDVERLTEMNDAMTDDMKPTHENDFNKIADWIEKKVKTF